jgi:predicted permease
MDTLIQDLKFALRSLARSPAFTVAAILTLALGIGANTAIFSIVDSVLLRPAPIDDAERVMMVWETDRNSGTTREPASYPDFLDFQQRSKTFTGLAAFASVTFNLTQAGGEPERTNAMATSVEYGSTLGLSPVAGRLLDDAETQPGGPQSVLISEDLANRLFDSPLAAIGKTVRLNDAEWKVVGVLPSSADFGARQILGAAAYGRGFADRSERSRIDVWIGLRASVVDLPRSTHPIFVVGRLAPGATREQAQTELASITGDLERQYPVNVARGAFIESLPTVVFGDVRPALLTLLAAVALVLLVACANVANLLLVRSSARMREVTVRVALGAGLRRLAQQFAVEGIVLTAFGAILGMILAFLAVDMLRVMAPASVPRVDLIAIDGRVLVVTLAVSFVVAMAFGLLPTLQARNHKLQTTLRGSGDRGGSVGREHRRFRSALIVTELAMASMLMVGAGLLVKSLYRLQHVDTGFASEGVLKGEYQLPASRYPRDFAIYPNWTEQQRFNRELVARLEALPGVEGVSLAVNHPLEAGYTSSIRVVGRETEGVHWQEPTIRMVDAAYFATMRLKSVAGRAFQNSDDVSAPPVAVINEAAIPKYFSGREPIGQQINLWGAARTIVGVITNERVQGLAREAPPAVYLPLPQVPSRTGAHTLLVRVSNDPQAIAPAVRAAIHELDASLPVFGIEPLPETVAQSIGQQRFTMIVLGAFAAVALLLAAVGVHGVLSYSVSQRTSEIGIRMALGADGRSVRSLVLGEGATLMIAGLGIGIVGAIAMTRVLTALLFDVSPYDPFTFGIVAVALAGVAMFATYLPARRASKVDPVEALRSE